MSYQYDYDIYAAYERGVTQAARGRVFLLWRSFSQFAGSKQVDIPVGSVRETGEHIAEIVIGVDVPTAATFDDCIEDGRALPRLRISKERDAYNGSVPCACG
jgi:hypothetical protein